MSTDALALSLDDTRTVRTALRRLDGRATVGDIASATGLVQAKAEAALRKLLEVHEGHLEVGEHGDVVYRFDPRMLRRDRVPLGERLRTKAWELFQVGFKVWIVAMLVIYFLVFVALLIAALFANRDDDGGGLGGGDRRHGGGGFGNFWLWYWLWSPGWGRSRPYYGERYETGDGRRGGRKDGPPFYKKVFAFVFGPDRPEDAPERRDRATLRIIRSRAGVISATELVQATGLGLEEAEAELGRLMAAHDGEPVVTPEGAIVYTFPSLMVSAHGTVEERRPPPAWRRLEPKVPLTGNSAGTNAIIVGLNGFNLVAAASAPFFIFPRLGIGGTAAEIALIWVPVIFSAVFFAVPGLRALTVARENARRALRNVRRVALGVVSRFTLRGDAADAFPQADVDAAVEAALGAKGRGDAKKVLDRLVAEFDGEVEVDAAGDVRFRFPGFREAFAASHRARSEAALDMREVGRIVYDSGDDDATAGERELADFDEELARGAPLDAGTDSASVEDGTGDLAGYLEDPSRYAYRDEAELAALENRVRAKGTVGLRR